MKRSEEFKDVLLQYFTSCEIFNRTKEMHESAKKDFNKVAKNYFDNISNKLSESKTSEAFDFGSFVLRITQIQKTKVIWNIEKLKKILGKDLSKRAINKKYEINNIEGLVDYLKTCGVSPKRFMSFLNVTETVNEEALENIYQLTNLTVGDLNDSFEITVSEPYYRIKKIMKDEQE